MQSTPLALAFAALLSPAAAAQGFEIFKVVERGDVIPGFGTVNFVDAAATNERGDWTARVRLQNPGPTMVLKNGSPHLVWGQSLAQPVGSTISSVQSIEINNHGDIAHNIFLNGTQGSFDDSGVYLNDTLVLQESELSSSPAFSAGTPYIGFFRLKFNDNYQWLLVASVNDSALPSSVDRALVRLQTDTQGNILSETVLYKEGDILPGQTEAVVDFGTNPHTNAFNEAGQVMYVATLTGPTATNAAIYIDDTLIAQKGSPSPIAGRNWGSITTSSKVDLNNFGGYVLNASLDGDTATNNLIVTNGVKVIQQGDPVPVPHLSQWSITGYGSGPVLIDDTNSILWYGIWNEPNNAVNRGLFLNYQLIVQQGVTQIDGRTITTLRGIQDGYTMSRNGEYIYFRAVLDDGTDGLYVLKRPGQITAIPGCTASLSSLTAAPSSPTIGSGLTLTSVSSAYSTSAEVMLVGSATLNLGGGCGLPLGGVGGELLLDIGLPYFQLPVQLTAGAPVVRNLAVPQVPAFIGAKLVFQALYADLTGLAPTPFDLTNAIEVTVGA